MTLIRSMLTPFGIVMGADSTLTVEYPFSNGKKIERHYTNAKKLQKIPHLKAGISWWGKGIIDGMNADTWLENYIINDHSTTLANFAESLRDKLRELGFLVTDDRNLRYGTIGFHLAGFIEYNGKNVPILYHIHNGKSETCPDIDPHRVNANLDWTPQKVLAEWKKDHFGGLRNGDFIPYAIVSGYLSQAFARLNNLKFEGQTTPFLIPYPRDNLDSWAEFIRFEIKMLSEIYALSNYPKIIGGKIATLTINNNGKYNYEMK